MSLTVAQMKKHLLLYNKMIRGDMKALIVKTPSKLTEEQVKLEFNKLFKSKNNYWIPKQPNTLNFNEEEFKKIAPKSSVVAKPKRELPKTPIPAPKAEEKQISLLEFASQNGQYIRHLSDYPLKQIVFLKKLKKENKNNKEIIKYLDDYIMRIETKIESKSKAEPKAEPTPKAEPKMAKPKMAEPKLSLVNFLKMNEDKINRFKASERQKKLDALEKIKKEYENLPDIVKYLDEEINKVKEYMKMDEERKKKQ